MMTWSKVRIATLKRCAKAGLSMRETAEQLGPGFTRNMVAGKAFRLGVNFRDGDLTDKRIRGVARAIAAGTHGRMRHARAHA